VAGVVDVFTGTGKVHKLAGVLQLRLAFELDLIQYSTAFTSWLVVFSISLMARASASEKFLTNPASKCGSGRSGLEFGKSSIGERDEPGHFDLHAAVHVALLRSSAGAAWPVWRHSARQAATSAEMVEKVMVRIVGGAPHARDVAWLRRHRRNNSLKIALSNNSKSQQRTP
jgi:hypothetical protein